MENKACANLEEVIASYMEIVMFKHGTIIHFPANRRMWRRVLANQAVLGSSPKGNFLIQSLFARTHTNTKWLYFSYFTLHVRYVCTLFLYRFQQNIQKMLCLGNFSKVVIYRSTSFEKNYFILILFSPTAACDIWIIDCPGVLASTLPCGQMNIAI